jgi:hypothetical protein
MPLSTQPPMSVRMFNPNSTSLNLAFSQAFSANWSMGEDNYFAARFAARVYDERHGGPVVLRSSLQFELGANYTNDSIPENALRVGDNNFFVEEVVVYPLKWMLDPYVSANLRTPITESFNMQFGKRMNIANLWDPVTTQQSAGFSYNDLGRSGMFTARTGFALRQVRAEHNTQQTDDYTTPKVKEAYRAESGIEFEATAMFRADSTITYNGRFSLFSSFQDLDVWNVRWENETRFVLWKSIGLTWALQVVHNVRQTRRTQFKQAILLGLIQDF